MGAKKHFRMGSFYRVSDRTGFVTRAEDTQMEWNGLIVERRVFEARQPQDFVTGVPDNQTVPYARPRPKDGIAGSSTLSKFQVFGLFPSSGVAFEVQNGSIMVNHAITVVTAASL
jgi:hypothetical protein